MSFDRRRFIALTVGAAAAACSKTSDRMQGYAPAATASPEATTGSVVAAPADRAGPGTTRAAITEPSSSAPRPSESTSSTSSNDASPPAAGTSTGGPARFVSTGPAGSNGVALTFHTNGDLVLAQRMLDISKAHGARATNFIVGDWLDANPTWARAFLDQGHELANHTYTHPTFASLSRSEMGREIVRCRDVLARLTGSGGRYFRPSGTDDGLAVPPAAIMAEAGAAGYGVVLGWDVEPFDYQDPGAAAVTSRVLDRVKGGSIVSLHFGHRGTVDALDSILGGLATRGLVPVTVSQLLA